MNTEITRRGFLERSALLAAGAAASPLAARRAAGAEAKKIAVGCRATFLKTTGAKDCWAAMRRLGAEVAEVTIREDLSLPELFQPGLKHSVATPDGIKRLADDLAAAKVRISAFCMFNRYDERPDLEVAWAAKAATAAKALGVPAIRIDVVPRKTKREAFLDVAVAILKKVMAATESTGVAFGIENHGHMTNRPDFLAPLFERVGSPRLGLTLDSANLYWFGHPLSKVYQICETFASRVCHTHCKSIRYPAERREQQRPVGWQYGKFTCPVYEGDIDYRRVVAILRKAGYANDLCVENESLRKFPADQRAAVLAREIRFLKELR